MIAKMSKRYLVVITLCSILCFSLRAQQQVDFDRDFTDWSEWVGKTVTFTNDFYVSDVSNRVIASHRLRSPEEYGEEGTAAYMAAETQNEHDACYLTGISLRTDCRPGTVIRGLTAKVTAVNTLQAQSALEIIYNELPTMRPSLGNANVVVCGANIENFFVTLGGYAGASNESQLATQKTKISKALVHMDADIYALCEVEEGPRAAPVLVDAMNQLVGGDDYDWIDAGFDYYDGVMVCFVYRKETIRPYGNYIKPYSYGTYAPREAIQCFEHISTGERFNISLSHFKAKSSSYDTDNTRQQNMSYLVNKISTALQNDPDILVMGDLNAYTMEESNLMLSRDEGFVDLLMRDDPTGYSYVYQNLVGYLDHAYCSPNMSPQVTRAVSYHLNADTQKSYGYAYGNTSMYRYADHDPILVGLRLGNDTKEGIEATKSFMPAQKEIRNGQIVVIRGGVVYTITGQRL